MRVRTSARSPRPISMMPVWMKTALSNKSGPCARKTASPVRTFAASTQRAASAPIAGAGPARERRDEPVQVAVQPDVLDDRRTVRLERGAEIVQRDAGDPGHQPVRDL